MGQQVLPECPPRARKGRNPPGCTSRHAERICKTELEYALVQGPTAMKSLLQRGARLASTLFSSPTGPAHALFQKALALDLDALNFDGVSTGNAATLSECDFCGKELKKKKNSHRSRCKTSMYCGRECQKRDWKRHQPFCQRNQEQNNT